MAWQGLSEIASNLTVAEVRFERQKRLFGLVSGPLVFFACMLVPPLPDVEAVGMRTAGPPFPWAWVCTWLASPTGLVLIDQRTRRPSECWT